jgi:hypothetical protein
LTFLAHGAHPRPHPRPRPRSRSRAFPRQVKKEISIMKLVRHDNIVFLKEVLASRTKVSLQGPFRSHRSHSIKPLLHRFIPTDRRLTTHHAPRS